MDLKSRKVILEHNSEKRLPIAGLTKLMTAYVVVEALIKDQVGQFDDVPISFKASVTGGRRMFIREGTKVPLMDLLKGVMVLSADDASVALQEYTAPAIYNSYLKLSDSRSAKKHSDSRSAKQHIASRRTSMIQRRFSKNYSSIRNFAGNYESQSEALFINEMNIAAKKNQMHNTRYTSVIGHEGDSFSTAYDQALLVEDFFMYKRNQQFERLVAIPIKYYEPFSQKGIAFNSISQSNTNSLLWKDKSVDGLMTVDSPEAGTNQVLSASRDDMRLVVVTMGSDAASSDGKKLLDFGFDYLRKKMETE